MDEILLSAEQWERVNKAYSGDLAVANDKPGPVRVRTINYRGFLYTSFSVRYGAWGDAVGSVMKAYKLLPEALFTGETTDVYHDKAAIEEGRRQRGDLTGLVVSVKGTRMVCSKEVRFLKGLPSKRVSFAEARDYDEQERRWGWRALSHAKSQRQWFSLEGHPVVRYTDACGDSITVLVWRDGDQLRDFVIANHVELSRTKQRRDRRPAHEGHGQLSLF